MRAMAGEGREEGGRMRAMAGEGREEGGRMRAMAGEGRGGRRGQNEGYGWGGEGGGGQNEGYGWGGEGGGGQNEGYGWVLINITDMLCQKTKTKTIFGDSCVRLPLCLCSAAQLLSSIMLTLCYSPVSNYYAHIMLLIY